MTSTTEQSLLDRISSLEQRLEAAERGADRGAVENVFSRYMHYHNAYEDERIIDELWVKPGTPGIRARYNNVGAYTTWESVTAYHRGRPRPTGKLLLHYTSTPVIEVAEDGTTAKGLWIMAGLESGLTDPDVAENVPDWVFSGGKVGDKLVWAHWVWCKYGVDFLRQDGEWKIWKFRCYELARAPFEENWISFGEKNQGAFDLDLMYFGDDGKPVFMPPADEPVPSTNHPYSPTTAQKLEPAPPVAHDTFEDTFK